MVSVAAGIWFMSSTLESNPARPVAVISTGGANGSGTAGRRVPGQPPHPAPSGAPAAPGRAAGRECRPGARGAPRPAAGGGAADGGAGPGPAPRLRRTDQTVPGVHGGSRLPRVATGPRPVTLTFAEVAALLASLAALGPTATDSSASAM